MTGRRRKPGRMGPFIEGYRAWLAGRGYTPGTVIHMLAMAGDLGRWMDTRDFAAGDLDRAVIAEFRDAMRRPGCGMSLVRHGLDPLLEYLEQQGVRAASGSCPRRRSKSWWSVIGGGLLAIVGWPRPRSSGM